MITLEHNDYTVVSYTNGTKTIQATVPWFTIPDHWEGDEYDHLVGAAYAFREDQLRQSDRQFAADGFRRVK